MTKPEPSALLDVGARAVFDCGCVICINRRMSAPEASGSPPTDVDRRLDEVRAERDRLRVEVDSAERDRWARAEYTGGEISRLNGLVGKLEAQVSQLTADKGFLLDLVRRLTIAVERETLHPGSDVAKALAMIDAEPKWRADSAHLGVTEAEVLKDLEKR